MRIVALNDIQEFMTTKIPGYKDLKILYQQGFILSKVDNELYTFSRRDESDADVKYGYLRIYDSIVRVIKYRNWVDNNDPDWRFINLEDE